MSVVIVDAARSSVDYDVAGIGLPAPLTLRKAPPLSRSPLERAPIGSRILDKVMGPTPDIPRMQKESKWFKRIAGKIVPAVAAVAVAACALQAKATTNEARFNQCGEWPVQFGEQPTIEAGTPAARQQFGEDFADAIDEVSERRGSDITPLANTNTDSALCWVEGEGGIQVRLDPAYATTVAEVHGIEGQEFGMELVTAPAPGESYFAPLG